MILSVTFLGTSASRPTIERNVTALAIQREGETLLFDCGEGTQRQMMRYGVSFGVDDIFFTHVHADHMLGLTGLIRTMALQGRTDPLRIHAAPRHERLLWQAITLGSDKQHFPILFSPLIPNTPVSRKGYSIVPYPVQHTGADDFGLALIEDVRLGRFNPDLARELGIPEGPLWGRIHKGESITLDDGRVIAPSDLVGPTRDGRKVVFTGDCRPSPSTTEMAADADLLIHEATFGLDEAARAVETGHSTAYDAATIAKAANVRQLILTHISSRYSHDAKGLRDEARGIFKNTTVARDGLTVEIPFVD